MESVRSSLRIEAEIVIAKARCELSGGAFSVSDGLEGGLEQMPQRERRRSALRSKLDDQPSRRTIRDGDERSRPLLLRDPR
jgi:hypothetical protein